MDRFLVRARGIEIHVFGHLGLVNAGGRRCRRLGAEIDLDHTAPGVRRREDLCCLANPTRGWLGKIEVAIDTINDALATKCRQSFVDLLADRAEFRIGGVAERQHPEFDAIQAWTPSPISSL